MNTPSIIASAKAPREHCIAFDKLDGSNIRVKFQPKKGWCLFGSRTHLFDASHPYLAGAIPSFHERCADAITPVVEKKFRRGVKEVIVFGEYVGEKSFAGIHDPEDPTKRFVLFDCLLVFKDRVKFMRPQEFVDEFAGRVETPKVIYEGNLTDGFIADVRAGVYEVTAEGVICKGTKSKGSFRGGVWMAKVKTQAYIDKLKTRFGDDWEKYAE